MENSSCGGGGEGIRHPDSGIILIAEPTQGIDEAVDRIEMYVREGADILFLDSPADDEEIRRAVAAASGRPSFAVLSPWRTGGSDAVA